MTAGEQTEMKRLREDVRQLRTELREHHLWNAFQKWYLNSTTRGQLASLLTGWAERYDLDTDLMCSDQEK